MSLSKVSESPKASRTQYGPLADLIGVWEGQMGDDIAPGDDRGTENNKFREQMIFEPMSLVQNHEQNLYVVRYGTKIWRLGEPNTFHEELGYWTWEAATSELMRCFIVPRGIALIAGGRAEMNATEFKLEARNGSNLFGICTSPFLDREFKTLSYTVTLRMPDRNTLTYEQDTVIQMPGHSEVFHHRDQNTLKRVSAE